MMTGIVINKYKGGLFKVKIENNSMIILCTLSGKVRKHKIRISLGDRVDVSIDIADITKGVIQWREK